MRHSQEKAVTYSWIMCCDTKQTLYTTYWSLCCIRAVWVITVNIIYIYKLAPELMRHTCTVSTCGTLNVLRTLTTCIVQMSVLTWLWCWGDGISCAYLASEASQLVLITCIVGSGDLIFVSLSLTHFLPCREDWPWSFVWLSIGRRWRMPLSPSPSPSVVSNPPPRHSTLWGSHGHTHTHAHAHTPHKHPASTLHVVYNCLLLSEISVRFLYQVSFLTHTHTHTTSFATLLILTHTAWQPTVDQYGGHCWVTAGGTGPRVQADSSCRTQEVIHLSVRLSINSLISTQAFHPRPWK